MPYIIVETGSLWFFTVMYDERQLLASRISGGSPISTSHLEGAPVTTRAYITVSDFYMGSHRYFFKATQTISPQKVCDM